MTTYLTETAKGTKEFLAYGFSKTTVHYKDDISSEIMTQEAKSLGLEPGVCKPSKACF